MLYPANDIKYHLRPSNAKYILMTRSLNLATLGIACLLSSNLNGQASHHDHGPVHQDTHLHGHVELRVALENTSLELYLESPSVNIVGFEHRATSAQQIQAAEDAKSILESPAEIFSFSDGNCSLSQSNVNFAAILKATENHQSGADGNKDTAHRVDHSEITASYKYNCQRGGELDVIRLKLVEHFPGIEKIKVIWLTDTEQGTVELTPKTSLIRIR
jgi:hypothetical protein